VATTVRGWAAACAAVLAVAGCAPAAPASAPAQQQGAADTGPPATQSAADCTRATKVTIVENSGGYSFSPGTIKLQRGGFIAVTNKTDRVHELVSKPDAGLVTSVLDLRERQVIQFPDEGTFAVAGAAGAVLHVTVAGESGCGAPTPKLTIKDGYAFSPAKLTVAPTINFTVVNKSSAAHTLTCDPDTGGNRDHSRLERGETEILAIDNPGTYTCHSVQHPSAKVVITVR
jgi:plastocyanin